MDKFRVTWVDDVTMDVEADNGTQAKAIARAQRGLKKSECKIASVAPVPAPAPSPTTVDDPQAEA